MQVPEAAIIVKVAPLFVQTDALPLLKVTGRLDDAVAATVNVLPLAALAGAVFVTVILWSALPTVMVLVCWSAGL